MTRRLSILLWTLVLVAGVLFGTAGSASASGPPSGVTHVSVIAGGATTGVDAHLQVGASISGRVTSVAGGQPVSASVWAYLNGRNAGSTQSDENTGQYTITGLRASATGYAVCVSGTNMMGPTASGGGSPTGYFGRCYGSREPWNGRTVLSSATLVPLTAGQQRTGIDVALRSAAAISGKVSSPSGAGIQAWVWAHNRSSGASFLGGATVTGRYTIKGLTASAAGYTVCFDNAGMYRPRCYKNVAWNGGSNYPAAATKVSATLGKTTTGVNQSLQAGAAISGGVTDARTGAAIRDVPISVYSARGSLLAQDTTDTHGHYAVRGLAPRTGVRVCAYPMRVSAALGYQGKCWKNVAWDGGKLPSGTTGVSLQAGKTRTGVSFRLARYTGSISGKITSFESGGQLSNAVVGIYRGNGSFEGSDVTNSTGSYRVAGLPASSTGYAVCVYAIEDTSDPNGTPPLGWSPRCYKDTAWFSPGAGAPAGATKVPLSPAHMSKTGIDITMRVGGGITGTVYFGADTSTPVPDVTVWLFSAAGVDLAATSTDGTGMYTFPRLSPAQASSTTGYTVCFDGRTDTTGSATGYPAQCYENVPWLGMN